MSLVMVDTSVWIDFFRKGESRVSKELDELLAQDRVTLCGIIEMELLRGVRSNERSRLQNLLAALHYVETTRGDFIRAGENLCQLREKGITIPSTDALIAMICIRSKIPLMTIDGHFDYIKTVKKHHPKNIV